VTGWKLAPGPPATRADLRRAQDRDRLLRTQLDRVRAGALAWRNGLGALLAALVGFSLIKGRSNVTQLKPGWGVVVGVLLLAAFGTGVVAALSLLRAAHGRPSLVKVKNLPPAVLGDHQETVAAARALLRGVVLALGCAALLVAAVAMTWYGPPRDGPQLQVGTPERTVCGSVVRVAGSGVVLRTSAGEVSVDLRAAHTMQPVASCPAAAP
jgi:hypothetical protein